jgi:hypothetical protein
MDGVLNNSVMIILTLILFYRSVLQCQKLQRRLEQVGHVEGVDTVSK